MKKLFAFCIVFTMLFAMPVVGESLRIHWTPSTATNIIRNVIYRSTSESTGFVAIDSLTATGPGDTLYTDVNVPAGTRYYYRLRCVAADGQRSSFSAIAVSGSYLLSTSVQSVKVVSVVKTAVNAYTVTWTSTSPTAGFVYYRIVNGTWVTGAWDTTLRTTHTTILTGLNESAQYEFRAFGYSSTLPLNLTASISFVTGLNPVPSPPTMKAIYPF